MRRSAAGVGCAGRSVARHRDVSLRLSYGYLEPDDLVEGVRRIAASAAALSRRPMRREAVGI